MREARVSLRERGGRAYGTKTEIKNVNSFRFVEQALDFEITRQAALLQAGGDVAHETLLWDAREGTARIMRSKEQTHDYRYFPEPDLPVLKIPASTVEETAASLPELPDERERRFVEEYGLPAEDAALLAGSRELADYFEAVYATALDARAASNWVTREVLHVINEQKIEIARFPVAPDELGRLIGFLLSGGINTPTARDVFRDMVRTGEKSDEIISRKGLEQINDRKLVTRTARTVLDAHPDAVAKYLRGKRGLLRFFIGELMRKTGGRVNPQLAREVIEDLLKKRG